MSDAPYQVIAAEIRRRIEAGELAPGDRVPSTRALVREFGVAMATATKALQVLQQQNLVHARQRLGYRFEGGMSGNEFPDAGGKTLRCRPSDLQPEAAQNPTQAHLDIVKLRLHQLAYAEGLAALSMRRIAAELGVSTMALYRYVGGKDALVLKMVDAAIGEFPFPAKPPATWRDGIETAARLQWAAYRRHLWLASAISLSRPQLLPNLLPHTDAVLRSIAHFGLDKAAALYTAISVFAYIVIFIGLVNLLPLPPFDGGHLAVLAIEKVRGRTVDLKKMVPVSAVVLALLGFLTISTLVLDIFKPLPNSP